MINLSLTIQWQLKFNVHCNKINKRTYQQHLQTLRSISQSERSTDSGCGIRNLKLNYHFIVNSADLSIDKI